MDEGTDNYDKWKWKIKGKAKFRKKKKLNKLQWFKTFKMVLKNRKNEKHQQPKVRKNNSYKETYNYL